MRQMEFHQARINAAETPVDLLNAGFAYLAAVIKKKAVTDPRKADQITQDTVEFLLRQASAHGAPPTRGRRSRTRARDAA